METLKPVWAPYYTLHKIYAGLQDVYVYCGNQQALEVCKRFADWVIARNGKLTDEQMQAMLGNEHGGMNETLANLYGLTGDARSIWPSPGGSITWQVIGPASKRQDRLTGLHANTQIPKFIGTARQYELTGEEWLKTASTFFWDTVVKERSYVIGGHSDGEHFSPKEKLSEALGPNTTETCNTYNMLKLTRHLFCWDPQAAVRRLLRAGPLQPHPLLAASGNGHDVLLLAAAVRVEQELQRSAGQLLVLHGHGRGEPCEVWREHLLP